MAEDARDADSGTDAAASRGDDGSADHGHGDAHDNNHEEPAAGRVTSPMQTYGTREVGIGAAVLVVGALVTFLLPLLAA